MANGTKEAQDENFESILAENKDKIVLVDFWAPWCGPCLSLAPHLEALAAKLPNLQVVKVNVDENHALAGKYSVRSIPMLVLFKNGELAETKVGAMTLGTLERWVETASS